jgi:phage tail-like protein
VTSSYLDHLPALFRDDPFVGEFLLAFEAVLSGSDDVDQPGLEQILDRLADHFDPATAPEPFLPWLAGWVAFSVRADWDTDTVRGFLQEIVPLYRLRGTLAGLQRMLEIYLRPLSDDITHEDVVIFDDFADPPHFFQVRLTLAEADTDRVRRTQEIARAIIDREKPAHTFYALKVVIPTMRLLSTDMQAAETALAQAAGRTGPELLVLNKNTWLGTAG